LLRKWEVDTLSDTLNGETRLFLGVEFRVFAWGMAILGPLSSKGAVAAVPKSCR
jgi:hypothetical protein